MFVKNKFWLNFEFVHSTVDRAILFFCDEHNCISVPIDNKWTEIYFRSY